MVYLSSREIQASHGLRAVGRALNKADRIKSTAVDIYPDIFPAHLKKEEEKKLHFYQF